jgi:alkylated DNA nucleotide flippase Atl1
MEAEWKLAWWRVTAPDGSVRAESRDEQECRELTRPGDTLARLEQRTEFRWVEVRV